MIIFTITPATKDDLPAILDVQKKAFMEVARMFNLKSLPQLEQTLESVIGEFESGTILKAGFLSPPTGADEGFDPKLDSRRMFTRCIPGGNDNNSVTIVGSVRAYPAGDTCHIGKLVVLPGYQNQGIGKALMREIEKRYKDIAGRYEIFTGSRDPRNLYLYDRLGYKSFKTEELNDEITFVYMQKYV